jgi:2,3-bisphosphoglycerate-dependent phosphoglycerate mutase
MSSVNGCPGAPILRVPPDRSGDPRRLWLVRHGESTWNARGVVQGQLDPGLSRSGREQAAECARFLSGQAAPGAIHSSDLRRALETAAPIAEALDLAVLVEPGLRERSLGDAEGRPSLELGPDRSGIDGGRVVDADAAPEGGESIRQLFRRTVSSAGRILSASRRRDVVVVCHGGVVRVLLAWLDGVGPDSMAWPEVDNGVPIVRSLPSAVTSA